MTKNSIQCTQDTHARMLPIFVILRAVHFLNHSYGTGNVSSRRKISFFPRYVSVRSSKHRRSATSPWLRQRTHILITVIVKTIFVSLHFLRRLHLNVVGGRRRWQARQSGWERRETYNYLYRTVRHDVILRQPGGKIMMIVVMSVMTGDDW